MRVAFVYPPFKKGQKVAFLPQNRQFVYSSSKEVRLYPVLAATAATMLRQAGHTVFWLDGITENLSMAETLRRLKAFEPDLVITETKAPVAGKTWGFVDSLKKRWKDVKVALVGDHVTYFPKECLKESRADYVLTGGDWDFLAVNLAEHLEKDEKLENGVYFRAGKMIRSTGEFIPNHNLDQSPLIDRDLTRFWKYKEADVLSPCAYMMFGRGCGGVDGRPGACTFCIWQHCLWALKPRLRSPEHVVSEIRFLVGKYKIREIFDDTDGGAHYDFAWLSQFYELLKKEKLLGKIKFSANSRADVLDKKTCRLLKKCGFRMLKVGVEAGTDRTLKMIGKGETTEIIRWGVKNAKDAGLIVHLSAMVGYPWEKEEDAAATLSFMKELLFYKTRVGDSLQASVIVPYPGTPLWNQAERHSWFIIDSHKFEKYDMSQPVLKSNIDNAYWCKKIWNIHLHPVFLLKTTLSVRSFNDIKFLMRGAFSHFGHVTDYE